MHAKDKMVEITKKCVCVCAPRIFFPERNLHAWDFDGRPVECCRKKV